MALFNSSRRRCALGFGQSTGECFFSEARCNRVERAIKPLAPILARGCAVEQSKLRIRAPAFATLEIMHLHAGKPNSITRRNLREQ